MKVCTQAGQQMQVSFTSGSTATVSVHPFLGAFVLYWCRPAVQVLQGLDKQPTRTAALEAALRGVFAGNIFDLGAAASAERYKSGEGAGFHCALDQLLPRPWVRGAGGGGGMSRNFLHLK